MASLPIAGSIELVLGLSRIYSGICSVSWRRRCRMRDGDHWQPQCPRPRLPLSWRRRRSAGPGLRLLIMMARRLGPGTPTGPPARFSIRRFGSERPVSTHPLELGTSWACLLIDTVSGTGQGPFYPGISQSNGGISHRVSTYSILLTRNREKGVFGNKTGLLRTRATIPGVLKFYSGWSCKR